MKKRILALVLLALVMVSVLSVPAYAASSKTVYLSGSRGWSSDIRCTLSTSWGRPKSGVVRATIPNWGVNVDIRMRNGSKVIWSENNAIRCPNKTPPAWIYRDFNLGNDHSYYNLSFRTSTRCSVAPYVTVKGIKNISSIS